MTAATHVRRALTALQLVGQAAATAVEMAVGGAVVPTQAAAAATACRCGSHLFTTDRSPCLASAPPSETSFFS